MSSKHDMDLSDDLGMLLWKIGTLGDLLQSYEPHHDGRTAIGNTYMDAGSMIFTYACETRAISSG